MIKPDFDMYPDNLLNTETFSERGVDTLEDVDYTDILMYVRDLLADAGADLQKRDEVDDVRQGVRCMVAANYVNLALKSAQGL